jgi:two-component system response regulator DevR
MKPLRLIILDEHSSVRHSLTRHLDRIPGLKVVLSTGDADEVLRKIVSLRPDIVLIDVRMRQASGLDTCKRIASAAPVGVQVAVLISYGDVSDRRKALQSGACGYLLKDLDTKKLARQIQEIAKTPACEENLGFGSEGNTG